MDKKLEEEIINELFSIENTVSAMPHRKLRSKKKPTGPNLEDEFSITKSAGNVQNWFPLMAKK